LLSRVAAWNSFLSEVMSATGCQFDEMASRLFADIMKTIDSSDKLR
jgi:hypothetical protein